MSTIYKAIPAIMEEIEAIKKKKSTDPKAPSWAFRGIDAFMNALHPLLAKHKVIIVPEVKDNLREPFVTASGAHMISVTLKMNYTAYAEDGSFITGATVGEAFDSGDKASNKAMSVALKYFVMQLFMVPTEDIDDPDKTDTEGLRGKPLVKKETYHAEAKKGADYVKSVKKVTKAQIDFLLKFARSKQIPEDLLMDEIFNKYKASGLDDLTMEQLQEILVSMGYVPKENK